MNYLKINQTNTCKFNCLDIFEYFYWPQEEESLFCKIDLKNAMRLEPNHAECPIEFSDNQDVLRAKIDKISISL